MARTVRDANLETRAARGRVKARKKPYYRAIEQGRHLGYYKGARGGTWLARYFKGAGQYAETMLGRADDTSDADGVEILSFGQAQDKARTWFEEQARARAGLGPKPTGPHTVADAMRDYLAWYADHKKGLRQATNAANVHILPGLGNIEVAKLTTAEIERWRTALAKAQARVRSGRSQKAVKHRPQSTDPTEGKRQRRATANRILTVLKAALNHAWRAGKVASDEQWRKVKPFHDVDAPVVRYLTEAECVRLVNACPADFRQMVRAALLTGCRYGELAALRVRDFNPDAGVLTIRTSKSGKARHVVLTEEGAEFFAQVTAGRAGDEIMFRRSDGEPWRDSHQQRPLREACKRAKIKPAVSFHILRHTHGSMLAMRGVPLPVIAKQLGHADTRMTEKHYAHLSPNYVADTIRASFPTLGIVEKGKVAALRPGRA
jgi:integrase